MQPYGQMIQPMMLNEQVNQSTGGQLGQVGQQYVLVSAPSNVMMLQPLSTGKSYIILKQ